MKNGYDIAWSERAITDLQNILAYLSENWTQKEIRNFSRLLDKRLKIIQVNPGLFPATHKRKDVRRSVLTPQTTIYYKVEKSTVFIITLFDNRRNPKKLALRK